MIEVQFWSERHQAYFCQWENGSGFLTISDLEHDKSLGDEIVWNCAE